MIKFCDNENYSIHYDIEGNGLNEEGEKTTVIEELFSISSTKELMSFTANLDRRIPFESALAYYCDFRILKSNQANDFDPKKFISSDCSAIMMGSCPVIFKGSNDWCNKCYLSDMYFAERMQNVYERCATVREKNPSKNLCLIVVPEKDFILSTIFQGEERFSRMRGAIYNLLTKLAEIKCPLVFDQSLKGMGDFITIKDYEYPDSHLHPRNYINIFSHSLRNFGFDWDYIRQHLSMKENVVYGDLGDKFGESVNKPYRNHEADFLESLSVASSGSQNFESPLGKTKQEFRNETPLIEKTVSIFGDSHSSIFAQRRLTYMFASTFRETTFSWNPMNTRAELDSVDSDYIVLEISLRFIL